MMNTLQIETSIHGRVLHEARDKDRLLIGFHGYGETADIHLQKLLKIPGIEDWSVAAVQALHPFYSKGGTVIGASWMTRLDRELAIADNINYVRNTVAALPPARTLVFLGFSQGVAMAARAAAHVRCDGLILLGSDIPPDVVERRAPRPPGADSAAEAAAAPLPPILLARGSRDEWYTDEKFKNDLKFVTPARTLVFDGGHEWTDEFRTAAGEFLTSLGRSDAP